MVLVKKAVLIVQTLRYLSFHQLFYLVYRRLFNWQSLKLGNLRFGGYPSRLYKTQEHFKLVQSVYNEAPKCRAQSVTFLNQVPEKLLAHDFSWHDVGRDKLWRYNLHYFDWLKDENLDFQFQSKVFDHWIAHNPIGAEDAWEPYPLSLRIVNWIKYFYCLKTSKLNIKPYWLCSLHAQVLYLSNNIEFHIRANHLLKNLVALLYGSLFFDDPSTRKLFPKIFKLLQQEMTEQFNGDGGHYERSPMYHGICLEDLMDLYNLFVSNPSNIVHQHLENELRNTIQQGLIFYQDMHLTSDRIGLFADAAQGIAPSLAQLIDYSDRLLIKSDLPTDSRSVYLRDTGYLCLNAGRLRCIANLGNPAPSYQPGHTHCDMFSFEMALDNQPFIVDTGVFEYKEGDQRSYCRSTAAHNSVQLGSSEQHEIWGAFRVGYRTQANIQDVHIEEFGGHFEAFHQGFSGEGRNVNHKRFMSLKQKRLNIADCLSLSKNEFAIELAKDMSGNSKGNTAKRYECTSRIHFHPRVRVKCLDSDRPTLVIDGKLVAYLSVDRKGETHLSVKQTACDYFPAFGRKEEGVCLELIGQGVLPIKIEFSLEFL